MNKTRFLCCASAHWGGEKASKQSISNTRAESNWCGFPEPKSSLLSSPSLCWKRMNLSPRKPLGIYGYWKCMEQQQKQSNLLFKFKKKYQTFWGSNCSRDRFSPDVENNSFPLAWQNNFANFLVYYFLWFSAVLLSGIWEVKTDRWL